METLAYLYLNEDFESSETKELDFSNLANLSLKATLGALGVASAAALVVGHSEPAQAHGYYGYRHTSYYSYRHYTPSYRYYSYYPSYHRYYGYYYHPCY